MADYIPVAPIPGPDFPALPQGTSLTGWFWIVTNPQGNSFPASTEQVRAAIAPNDLFQATAPGTTPGIEGQKFYHIQVATNSFDLYQRESGVWALKLSGISTQVGGGNANAAPTVTLNVSTAALTLGGSVTLSADAFDSDGTISKVEFYEGGQKLTTITAGNAFIFDASPATVGVKNYYAIAYDNQNLSRQSAPKTVEVRAVGNQLPLISINLSASATQVGQSVTISATASDPDGQVMKVEFFDSGVSIGVATSQPYATTYAPGQLGNCQITAVATDNQGGKTTAQGKYLTVTSVPTQTNQPPTVSYSQSVNTIVAGQGMTLSAVASDSDGTVQKVEFFQNSTKVGEALNSPYTLQFSPTTAGSFVMSAKATDNQGATSVTSGMTLTVTAAPVNNITPLAPTFSGFNDTQQGGTVTLVVQSPYVLSDYRVALPGSSTFTTPSSATITVGNVAGPVQAYIVAATGRNQSPTGSSPSFTTYTAPVSYNTSITGVAGNETADGVEMAVAPGVSLLLEWNGPLPVGSGAPAPSSLAVFFSGQQLASVYFDGAAIGQTCRFTYQGQQYTTTFQNSDTYSLN